MQNLERYYNTQNKWVSQTHISLASSIPYSPFLTHHSVSFVNHWEYYQHSKEWTPALPNSKRRLHIFTAPMKWKMNPVQQTNKRSSSSAAGRIVSVRE